ncbi:F-box domain-containing protein [Colletotrichum higginsianum]|nr:F-box domain-containing protein [Colletotrichum higginsianum]
MTDGNHTPQAPSFLGLPIEIQTQILQQLVSSHHESIPAVLRTCKHLYRVASPMSVHTYENATSKNMSEHARKRSRNLDFLRHITIAKPELAHNVRRISIIHVSTSLIYRLAPANKRPLGPSSDEMAVYTDLIDASGLSDHINDWEAVRKEWLQGLADGLVEQQGRIAQARDPAVAPAAAPPHQGRRREPRYVSPAIGPAPGAGRPLLDGLREYFGEPESPKSLFHFFNIGKEFMQLPRLESFTCACLSNSGPNGHLFDEEANPPGCSNVQNLSLLDANVTIEGLRSLIRACKGLKSFHWTPGDSTFSDMQIKLPELAQALSTQSDTLQHLHIDYQDRWRGADWYAKREGFFIGTSLKEMASLKSLRIGMEAFLGFTDMWRMPDGDLTHEQWSEFDKTPRLIDHLPPSLECLELHGCREEVIPHVQEVLDRLRSGRGSRCCGGYACASTRISWIIGQ